MPRTLASDSRRRFLRHAAAGAGAGLVFGLIPWQDVLARASTAGIAPGTRVDAQGRRVEPSSMTGYEAFIGEIILTPYSYAPQGYAACNGDALAIRNNSALFSLIGVTFGGDGINTFRLPDLRGRLPRGQGTGSGLAPVSMGQQGGVETVTLTSTQMPIHAHALPVASGRRVRTPTAASYPGATLEVPAYGGVPDGAGLATDVQGGSQPHPNLPPYLVLNFYIALQGVFPQRP